MYINGNILSQNFTRSSNLQNQIQHLNFFVSSVKRIASTTTMPFRIGTHCHQTSKAFKLIRPSSKVWKNISPCASAVTSWTRKCLSLLPKFFVRGVLWLCPFFHFTLFSWSAFLYWTHWKTSPLLLASWMDYPGFVSFGVSVLTSLNGIVAFCNVSYNLLIAWNKKPLTISFHSRWYKIHISFMFQIFIQSCL